MAKGKYAPTKLEIIGNFWGVVIARVCRLDANPVHSDGRAGAQKVTGLAPFICLGASERLEESPYQCSSFLSS
jgi:hypothetical protein